MNTKNKKLFFLEKKVYRFLAIVILFSILISHFSFAISVNDSKIVNPFADNICRVNASSNIPANSPTSTLIANNIFANIPDVTDNSRSIVDVDGDGDSSLFLPTMHNLSNVDNNYSYSWRSSDNRSLFLGVYYGADNQGYVSFYPTERIIKICLEITYSGEEKVLLVKDIRIPKAEIRDFVDDPGNPNKTKKYYQIINDTFSNTSINNTLYAFSMNGSGVFDIKRNLIWFYDIFKLNGENLNLNFNVLDTGVLWEGNSTRCQNTICTADEIFRDLKNLTSQVTTSCVDIKNGTTIIPFASTTASTSPAYGCNKYRTGFSTDLFLSPAFANARYITDYVLPEATTENILNTSDVNVLPATSVSGKGLNRYGVVGGPYTYLKGFLNPEDRTAVNASDTIGVLKGADPSSSFLPSAVSAEIHGGQYEPRYYNCNINDTVLFENGVYSKSPYNVSRYNGETVGYISDAVNSTRCSGLLRSDMLVNQKTIYTNHSYNNNNIWNTPILFSLYKKGVPTCRGKSGNSTLNPKNVNYNTNSSSFSDGCDNGSFLSDRLPKLPVYWNSFSLHYNLTSAHGFRSDINLKDSGIRKILSLPGIKYDNLSVWLPVDSKNNIDEKNYFPAYRFQTGDPTVTGSFPSGQPSASGAKFNSILDEYAKNRSRDIQLPSSWRK